MTATPATTGIGHLAGLVDSDLDAQGNAVVVVRSDIDLAFEVDETIPASAVHDAIRAAGGELLWSVRLFDVFRGASVAEGRRSLAFSLRFQAPDRTLTEADVAGARATVIDAVQTNLGATLRG